jgi:hypothetical protein
MLCCQYLCLQLSNVPSDASQLVQQSLCWREAHTALHIDTDSLIESHGRLKQETWQDKETTQARFATRIIATDVAIKILAPPSEEWREAPNVRRNRAGANDREHDH